MRPHAAEIDIPAAGHGFQHIAMTGLIELRKIGRFRQKTYPRMQRINPFILGNFQYTQSNDLLSNSTYYVRAYAVTENNIVVYGNEISFVTAAASQVVGEITGTIFTPEAVEKPL